MKRARQQKRGFPSSWPTPRQLYRRAIKGDVAAAALALAVLMGDDADVTEADFLSWGKTLLKRRYGEE